MISKRRVFILKQVWCHLCDAFHLHVALSLVVEMRQTASNVIEAESFLKKHFEALPVGIEELPNIALSEPTHILCTTAQHSPPLFLYHPCTHACRVHVPLEGY